MGASILEFEIYYLFECHRNSSCILYQMGRFWKYILVQRNDPFRFIADSSPFWEIYMPRRVV
uniref:Uncharacterized protein n=1 Tax=Lepeophtheirus salmonis TaxID=72036 RepID=A0A0K2TVE7_LEPSM